MDFLTQVLPSPLVSTTGTRPHVTLTYAQSLDARIAGVNGSQLLLSGKESMQMTHWMRSMHDAILVGIGTLLNDDPQLNTRHLPPRDQPYSQPRPVIIDTHLRTPPSCKLLTNYQSGTGLQPILFCVQSPETESRKKMLQDAGAMIHSVPPNQDGRLSLPLVLAKLHELGYQSVMVEGGQSIISSFLSLPKMVDILIVTVAPCLVGHSGLGALPAGQTSRPPKLSHIRSVLAGPDTIIACRLDIVE